MEIESFFPGRVRIRSTLFTQQEVLNKLYKSANMIEGIIDVSGNPATGSVIILYDEEVISVPKLIEIGSRLLAEIEDS